MTNTPNLLDIHQSIVDSFTDEEALLPSLYQRQQELQHFLSESVNVAQLSDTLTTEATDLSRRIHAIESKENLYFYLLKVSPLIERYYTELSKPVELNFMGESSNIDQTQLHTLYNEYIQLVQHLYPKQEFTPLDIKRECATCSNVQEKIIQSTNTVACSNCGTEHEQVKFTFSYKDTDRINISSKYTYDRRLHFKECMNQFQGKQNSTIKPVVYEKLIEQLVLHGIVSSDESIPKQERFKNVTKSQIILFLKEIHCSHHYEDLNLIYHQITGKKLEDITHLEKVLLEDFDILSKLYDEEYIKTKKITRKNFINTQYVLYQLLRRHKYPCKKTDFTFLKTLERKSFHDEVCSHLFKILGWNFTYMF